MKNVFSGNLGAETPSHAVCLGVGVKTGNGGTGLIKTVLQNTNMELTNENGLKLQQPKPSIDEDPFRSTGWTGNVHLSIETSNTKLIDYGRPMGHSINYLKRVIEQIH